MARYPYHIVYNAGDYASFIRRNRGHELMNDG